MSVTTEHEDYEIWAKRWKKMRDAIGGTCDIKDSDYIADYLPPLSGHIGGDEKTNAKYETYKEYATWYDASGRTVEGLLGLIYRKEPIVTIPEFMNDIKKDINLKGDNATMFSKNIVEEILSVYRTGVLLDMPSTAEGMTQAEIDLENIRPYARIYKAESIINWSVESVNNKVKPTMIVLKENIDTVIDEFEVETETVYRVLSLEKVMDQETGNKINVYMQRVFKQMEEPDKDGQTVWREDEDLRSIPLIHGEPLNYIPFWCITEDGVSWDITSPSLEGLVDMNISHFRNSANFENGLIFTGNPTPYVSGYAGDSKKLPLGSTMVLQLQEGGSAGFMEFSGQGLLPISNSMSDKEKLMAVLGARILASEKKAVETAEVATIHRAGEQGILGTIANIVSNAMTEILKTMAVWEGKKETSIVMELNTDYMPAELSGADMLSLMDAWQRGAISTEVMRWNFRQGERIPASITDEEMDEQIKENPAPAPAGLDGGMFNEEIEAVNDDEEADENENEEA